MNKPNSDTRIMMIKLGCIIFGGGFASMLWPPIFFAKVATGAIFLVIGTVLVLYGER